MRTAIISFLFGLSAAPALAFDDCLVGSWVADTNSLADTMGAQMQGTATATAGDVTMTVTPDGLASISVNNLTLNVVVPDVPPMDVSVNGASTGRMTAEAGRWSAVPESYDLVGSANVLGQVMTIPFSSETGILGGGSGGYTCSATEATFDSDSADARMPPRWTRSG
ncbi:MAG: hypothetical protein AAFQ09_06315 [Pseudomonadota bacterium]